jgi:hypothetical protein
MQLRTVFDAERDLLKAAQGPSGEAHFNLNLLDLAAKAGVEIKEGLNTAMGISAQSVPVGRLTRSALVLNSEGETLHHIAGHSTSLTSANQISLLSADGAQFTLDGKARYGDPRLLVELPDKTRIMNTGLETKIELPSKQMLTQDTMNGRFRLNGDIVDVDGVRDIGSGVLLRTSRVVSAVRLADGTAIESRFERGAFPSFRLTRGTGGGTAPGGGDRGFHFYQRWHDEPVVFLRESSAQGAYHAPIATGTARDGLLFV